MLRSMTGYGRAIDIVGGREILVEIKAVNHRYYEFSSRVPRSCAYLDEKLKSLLNGNISRGKVEVSVIINNENCAMTVDINKEIAKAYLDCLESANEEFNLEDDVKLTTLLRLPDVFNVKKVLDDEDEMWECVKGVAQTALDKFISMREIEGQRMKEDLLSRLLTIEQTVAMVEEKSPCVTQAYRDKLFAKISELVGDRNIDEHRILTEAAIFADKTATDEETVRLKSHIAQFRDLVESPEAVGKKLDFLVQEMNREVNTTGSKCQDLEITRMVLDMKAEIEKIREQIQNIE